MAHQSDLIATDIEAYLAEHERKDLLRLLTCGSVDDGKSTLIGRLLHDSGLIYEDHLRALEADSLVSGTTGDQPDLALLMDGLKAEREQGITIDVAYRYFSTKRRKFIIADTPGHVQYTRNMVTGASTAQLALIAGELRHGHPVEADFFSEGFELGFGGLQPFVDIDVLLRAFLSLLQVDGQLLCFHFQLTQLIDCLFSVHLQADTGEIFFYFCHSRMSDVGCPMSDVTASPCFLS